MGAWLLGVAAAAAAGTTTFDGALTAGGRLATVDKTGSAQVSAHARLDVARTFDRFFVEGHGSLLLRGPLGSAQLPAESQPIALSDLGSQLTLGYRPRGAIRRVALEVLPFSSIVRYPAFDWANVWGLGSGYAPMVTVSLSTERLGAWLSARVEQGLVLNRQLRLFPSLLAGFEAGLPGGALLCVRGLRGPRRARLQPSLHHHAADGHGDAAAARRRAALHSGTAVRRDLQCEASCPS